MDSRLAALAVVPVILWLGVAVYMWTIDRKLARLESAENLEDDL